MARFLTAVLSLLVASLAEGKISSGLENFNLEASGLQWCVFSKIICSEWLRSVVNLTDTCNNVSRLVAAQCPVVQSRLLQYCSTSCTCSCAHVRLSAGQEARVAVVSFNARGVSGYIRFTEVEEGVRIETNLQGLRGE